MLVSPNSKIAANPQCARAPGVFAGHAVSLRAHAMMVVVSDLRSSHQKESTYLAVSVRRPAGHLAVAPKEVAALPHPVSLHLLQLLRCEGVLQQKVWLHGLNTQQQRPQALLQAGPWAAG
jgi:hypothetical protein